MPSQYPLLCVVASIVVSCGCVALELLRMRKSREELARLGDESDERLQAEEDARANLENQIADLASKLELSTLERREIARTNQQLAAAVDARTAELKFARDESALKRDELARAQAQIHTLNARPETPARSPELEAKLASRDEELKRSAASIESLQAELASGRQQLAAVNARCGEFERDLKQRAEREQQRELHEQELEGVRSARTSEFENQLAIHDEELRLHAASMEAMRGELLARQQELEASVERCGELERELEKRAQAAEEWREKANEALSGESARTSELESRLESRENALRESASRVLSLQAELAERYRQIEVAGERCRELEQESKRREGREAELANMTSSRAIELEVQLAGRDEELNRRSASIESLRDELAASQRNLDASLERCADLERKCQHEVEHDREHEIAMSARAAELEGQLAGRDEELRQRALAIETLQAEVETKSREHDAMSRELEAKSHELDSKSRELGAADAPVRELEKQLQLYRELERERLRHENELEIARLARTNEFERQIGRRDGDLELRRGEIAQLMDRCASLSDQIERGNREVRERDQRLLESTSRVDALNMELERGRQEAKASEAISIELMDNRISALFDQGSKPRAKALSPSYSSHLAQGDFDFAMQGLLGESEPLSAASFARLSHLWREEHEAWKQAALGREVVYLWADGIHVKAGLKTQSAALLVIVASFVDGTRSVIAVESGDRASKDAWLALLRTLIGRDMNVPRLIVADEDLGLWAAIDELGWDCARQHCWKHKTAQVLAALPRPRRSQASKMLRAMSNAKTRVEAKKLRDRFVKRCGVRCADAGELLCDDWKQLTAVYAFPEDHWLQLRTSAVVETPLGAIDLSCAEPKPFKPTPDAEAILWKLLSGASSTLRKLSAPHLLPSILPVRSHGQENSDERSPTRAA